MVLALVGCSSSRVGADAGVEQDAPLPDAAVDAAPDAGIAVSPRCATSPQVLWNAEPQQLGGLAIVGDVAYVSRYALDLSAQPIDGVVLALDRRTGAELAEVLTGPGYLGVLPTPGGALATDGTQLWELRPGEAPALRVTGRGRILRATTDATHVYWTENSDTESDRVYRQARAGGEPSLLMSCDAPWALTVANGWVYCNTSQQVVYTTVTGGSPGAASASGLPVVTLVVEGTDLYAQQLMGALLRIPLQGGATEVVRPGVTTSRTAGLTLTPTHGYTTGTAAKVFDRATLAETLVDDMQSYGDPILVDDELYLISSVPTVGGATRVLRCVD